MTTRTKRLWQLGGLCVAALVLSIGSYQWWQARLDARIDLNQGLVGHWPKSERLTDLVNS